MGSLKGGRRLRDDVEAARVPVSIVIVVFRAQQELRPLLESIFDKPTESLQVIVIDGGSDDGTVALLEEWDNRVWYWLSEPDQGIYDAMNKGVQESSGDYILHLNAGDRLVHLPITELALCYADNVDAACFAVNMMGFGIHRPRTGFILRFSNSWHHQGVFYRRRGHMGYDTRYRIYGDFDLNQRMMLAGKSARLFDLVVAEQVVIGVSGDTTVNAEQYLVIRKNFGWLYVWIAKIWWHISPIIPWLKRRFRMDNQG